jgi:PAS domain S-box-containing protein
LASLKTLLKLLSPKDLLADPRLVQLIVGDEGNDQAVLTPAEVVIENLGEAIVSITLDYAIDGVNSAFHKIAGLTADEAIGQRLTILFPHTEGDSELDSTAQLYKKLQHIRQGGSAEGSVIVRCVNGLGVALAVDISVVAHTNLEGCLQSFSLLMRDLSQQATGEAQSKDICLRCERLVQQLMPMDVYAGLNGGTTVFSSASATVISIEITGLLENVTTYSPSHLLEAISAVYDLFDDVASRHACVRRIRYGSNEIIACCGLFDFVDQQNDQVEQAALACIEFCSYREEISEKLALEMDIKCGIAFGGPVIGDLLSVESPQFDITGPIVKEAIDIRESAAPGTVHVSASVQGMLAAHRFNFHAFQVPGQKISGVFQIERKQQ